MSTDGVEDRGRDPRDRHRETQRREHCPEATVGSEEEERRARGHESAHSEYRGEQNRVPERVHATRRLRVGAARARHADGHRHGRHEEGRDVPPGDPGDLENHGDPWQTSAGNTRRRFPSSK